MMKIQKKKPIPVEQIRRYLEPGPIVLVSSAWKKEVNIMTMGWHTVMEFSPSLIGCVIAAGNHSFELIKKSGECVINIPTIDLIDQLVGIGNCSGRDVDKFEKFGLTPVAGEVVQAPLIAECHANLECRLYDRKMIAEYNFFIFEVVAAQVAVTPKYPKTVHYTGDGVFRTTERTINRRSKFQAHML